MSASLLESALQELGQTEKVRRIIDAVIRYNANRIGRVRDTEHAAAPRFELPFLQALPRHWPSRAHFQLSYSRTPQSKLGCEDIQE
jgi:hypothetical protein